MARILVVDDSPSVYHFVRRELELDGHRVDKLVTFTELPTYLGVHAPDLILLDLEMPALSGVAFGQFVRRMEKKPTPIVIYSSLSGEAARQAASEVSAVGVLTKAGDGHELRDAVRQYLSSEEPQ